MLKKRVDILLGYPKEFATTHQDIDEHPISGSEICRYHIDVVNGPLVENIIIISRMRVFTSKETIDDQELSKLDICDVTEDWNKRSLADC